MSDRVVWTDGQYSDVLYIKSGELHHRRGRLVVGLLPLDAVVALDYDVQRSTAHGDYLLTYLELSAGKEYKLSLNNVY